MLRMFTSGALFLYQHLRFNNNIHYRLKRKLLYLNIIKNTLCMWRHTKCEMIRTLD